MLTDVDDKAKEPARMKAERRWANYGVTKRLKEKAKKAEAQRNERNENELAIAETIINEKPDKRGSVIRAQTKFAKEIRMMMEGHAKRNLYYHLVALKAKRENEKRLLLRMKLRLLELKAEQDVRINRLWSE